MELIKNKSVATGEFYASDRQGLFFFLNEKKIEIN